MQPSQRIIEITSCIYQQVLNQGFANGGFDNCIFGQIQIQKWQIQKNTNMWISVFRQELNTEMHIFAFFGFAILGFGFPQNGNYQNPRLQNPGLDVADEFSPPQSCM